MTIEEKLKAELKELMRNKNVTTRAYNDALRALILEKKKSPGFEGEITDEIAVDIITAYQKKLQKALDQFGEQSDASYSEKLTGEIKYCAQFLPSKLTEDEIKAAIVAIKADGEDNTNGIMKRIMADYKGRVDGKQVRELILAS